MWSPFREITIADAAKLQYTAWKLECSLRHNMGNQSVSYGTLRLLERIHFIKYTICYI